MNQSQQLIESLGEAGQRFDFYVSEKERATTSVRKFVRINGKEVPYTHQAPEGSPKPKSKFNDLKLVGTTSGRDIV
jgi:hypothetical protein